MGLVLFAYAFLSTVAIAVVPHEPVVMWFGANWGVWRTAGLATAGTAAASVVDHRLFAGWLGRIAHRPVLAAGSMGWLRRWFARAPFAVIAVSGLTPLPALPFKVAAFSERYPLLRYVAATTVGRFPRYLLLAWLGFTLSLPGWVFVALIVLFLLPTLNQGIRQWKRPDAK